MAMGGEVATEPRMTTSQVLKRVVHLPDFQQISYSAPEPFWQVFRDLTYSPPIRLSFVTVVGPEHSDAHGTRLLFAAIHAAFGSYVGRGTGRPGLTSKGAQAGASGRTRGSARSMGPVEGSAGPLGRSDLLANGAGLEVGVAELGPVKTKGAEQK